jgi:hypothetical protein
MALEIDFSLGSRSTIICGRTLQSRQRGDPFFVESGRGKWLLWKVTEKSGKYPKWEVSEKKVGSA